MALEFASRKATFPNYRKFETTFAGRPFVVETGKLCGLANGSAMIRYGETCVLCNVTMSEKPREGVDFFPLSVEFEEKLYAAGRIPGSFMRREGRPGEHAILSSRVVDRPIRPLFPKDMRNDVCVTMTVMSLDPDCSPEIAGMNGASLAIAMSDIPWNGPIGGVAVGYVDGEIVLNPTKEQRERSDLALTLAASMEKIVMIEAGANEVTEEVMMDAIKAGHEEIKKLLTFMNGIVAEIGKPKKSFTPVELDHALLADVYAKHLEDVKAAMNTDDKNVRDAAMLPIMDAIAEEHPELNAADLDLISYKLQKKVVRTWLLEEGKRVDGRGINEIRPLAAEVGVLPRVHGSGLFTRGQTQVLSVCTLNTLSAAQKLAEVAVETARTAKVFGIDPKVAVLSFSTKGSGKGGTVQLSHDATEAQKRAPELAIDGELQFDAAVSPVVAATKCKGSPVAGQANTFIFPCIEAGNIGYKIAQRLGGYEAYGPILQGLNAPINDLSRGCNADEVYKMAIITAALA